MKQNNKGHSSEAVQYAEGLSTQLRKGFLALCVLKVCAKPRYTTEIIATLHEVDMVVVEGTIYPLLSRLSKDGLLTYEWQESEQGPPRKYYHTTPLGTQVAQLVSNTMDALTRTIERL